MKSLTIEELNKRFTLSFEQKVEVIEYKNRRSAITLRCLECGHIWKAQAATVISLEHKHHCPHCGVSKKVELQCAYCGEKFLRYPSDINKSKTGLFYCSKECGNKHKNQIRFENGEWDNSKNYRSKAFSMYEHKCAVCGWNDDERILEAHHIDQDHANNNIENLCILCPTCHRKITLGYYDLNISDFTLFDI